MSQSVLRNKINKKDLLVIIYGYTVNNFLFEPPFYTITQDFVMCWRQEKQQI